MSYARILRMFVLALTVFAAVAPASSAFARHGADDPPNHDAEADFGGD